MIAIKYLRNFSNFKSLFRYFGSNSITKIKTLFLLSLSVSVSAYNVKFSLIIYCFLMMDGERHSPKKAWNKLLKFKKFLTYLIAVIYSLIQSMISTAVKCTWSPPAFEIVPTFNRHDCKIECRWRCYCYEILRYNEWWLHYLLWCWTSCWGYYHGCLFIGTNYRCMCWESAS